MAYASCGSDLPDIISLDTEDNNSVYSCESWEILAPLPQREIPSTSRNARFTSKNEGHLYRTKDTRNVSDKVEEYLEKMTPALPPCEVCQLIESNATSRESLKFWRAVDETSTSETSCHVKYYVYFFKKLEESFPDEPGIKNRQVMNLLQTILRVEGKNDTRTVSLENFVQAVKYFGPVCTASKCCTFVSELEILCIKSLHYRHKHKKGKISWFAGFMAREDAEARLSSQKDSTYLVRISENTDQGGFVLSVKSNGSVHHFEITSQLEVNAQGEHCCTKFLFNDTTYYNLAALVDDLKFVVISPEDEGIDIQCRTICPGLPLNGIITGYKKARTVKR